MIVIVQQQRERMPSPFNDLACRPSDQEYRDWTTKSHMMLPNYLFGQITLLRQSRKSIFDSSTETESCPALDKTDINDAGYLEQSPRKIFSRYDCETIPFYENQEGYLSDLAERASCWDIESTVSISSPPDSTRDVTTITTPIRSASQPCDIDVESAAPENIPETPPVAACYAPKKRKLCSINFKKTFESSCFDLIKLWSLFWFEC